jgi:signal transduction histidine kinase
LPTGWKTSADPAVRRAAPKLVNSISRAVNLCETTLAFGKAEEPAPTLSRFNLAALVSEVTEGEAMASDHPDCEPVEFLTDIPAGLIIRADRDQLFRVLSNLARNARQAIEATRKPGTIEIGAGETDPNGGSASAIPAPACRKRPATTCSSRFRAARARAAPGWAWPLPPISCATTAAGWSFAQRRGRHGIHAAPAPRTGRHQPRTLPRGA